MLHQLCSEEITEAYGFSVKFYICWTQEILVWGWQCWVYIFLKSLLCIGIVNAW